MASAAMVFMAANLMISGPQYYTAPGVPFASELYDDAAWHDPASPSCLTVPAGVSRVRLGANISFYDIDDGKSVVVAIAKNGVANWQGRAAGTGSKLVGDPTAPRVSISTGAIPVSQGDCFAVFVTATTDSSYQIIAGISNFWIEDAS